MHKQVNIMDANKLEKLREISYKIFPCCGLCKNGNFVPSSLWGTCKIKDYQHKKHTKNKRQLSIHRFGGCNDYIINPDQIKELHAYQEFIGDEND